MPFGLGFFAAAGAGAAAASFELIQTAFGTGSSGTIEFTNIPQTYKHLQLRMVIRHGDTSSANLEDCQIRFNGATGNVYSIHWLQGNGSAVSSGNFSSQNIMYGALTNAPSSTTNAYSATVLDVLDYTSTTKNKTIRSLTGSAPITTQRIMLYSGSYQATTAVSSIQILSPNTTTKPFNTAARFSLYGIRG